MAARGGIDYAAVAKNLGVNEGAARVAVHRLRKRFREIYREEISQTLADGAIWRRNCAILPPLLAPDNKMNVTRRVTNLPITV